jgi:hypothetical protein
MENFSVPGDHTEDILDMMVSNLWGMVCIILFGQLSVISHSFEKGFNQIIQLGRLELRPSFSFSKIINGCLLFAS